MFKRKGSHKNSIEKPLTFFVQVWKIAFYCSSNDIHCLVIVEFYYYDI